MKYCPNCNEAQGTEYTYCPKCGTELKSLSKCECGCEIFPSYEYCPDCGEKVEREAVKVKPIQR